MYIWYKLLTYLFQPLSIFFLFFRKLKKKEHQTRYLEKLGQISKPREKGFLLWCHVASVGEAMSILPLVYNFEKEKDIDKILITTITLSSSQILNKKFSQSKKIIHQFLPLDTPSFVKKFLNHWKPNLSIFIDSEIWPNLIFEIKKKKIPLLLVNARITNKTFIRWNFLKNFSKRIFEKFDLCLVADSQSEEYLKILGAKNIKSYGNLKFTNIKSEKKIELNEIIKSKIANRKIWCAASTHPSEEIFCGKTHLFIEKSFKNILTVIIPRHIDRVSKIKKELSNLKLNVVLHSSFEKINEDTDILLIDAYGETKKFFQISKCVFLGKSLIKALEKDSGQNPIEPARLGCKIYHGPFISNFIEVYKYLNSLNVSKKVLNSDELGQSIVEEFINNGEKNQRVITEIENYGQNTLNNVLKEIKIYINNEK